MQTASLGYYDPTQEPYYRFKVSYLENDGKNSSNLYGRGASLLANAELEKAQSTIYETTHVTVNYKTAKLIQWLLRDRSDIDGTYTRGLHAVAFIYSSEKAFQNIAYTIAKLKIYPTQFVKILIGNSSTGGERSVSHEEAIDFAKKNGFSCFMVRNLEDEEQRNQVHMRVAELCIAFITENKIPPFLRDLAAEQTPSTSNAPPTTSEVYPMDVPPTYDGATATSTTPATSKSGTCILM